MQDTEKAEKTHYPWRLLYALVAGFLLLQIILYYWLTQAWA